MVLALDASVLFLEGLQLFEHGAHIRTSVHGAGLAHRTHAVVHTAEVLGLAVADVLTTLFAFLLVGRAETGLGVGLFLLGESTTSTLNSLVRATFEVTAKVLLADFFTFLSVGAVRAHGLVSFVNLVELAAQLLLRGLLLATLSVGTAGSNDLVVSTFEVTAELLLLAFLFGVGCDAQFGSLFGSFGLSVVSDSTAFHSSTTLAGSLTQNTHVLVTHDVGHANSEHGVVRGLFGFGRHLGVRVLTTGGVGTAGSLRGIDAVALGINVVLVHVVDVLLSFLFAFETLVSVVGLSGFLTVGFLGTVLGGVHTVGLLLTVLSGFHATSVAVRTFLSNFHPLAVAVGVRASGVITTEVFFRVGTLLAKLHHTGGRVGLVADFVVLKLSVVGTVFHLHELFGLMGLAELAFFALALGFETAVSSFLALSSGLSVVLSERVLASGQFLADFVVGLVLDVTAFGLGLHFCSVLFESLRHFAMLLVHVAAKLGHFGLHFFFVDVFYNLHNLAVSAFGMLTADFSVFHKWFLWEIVFKVSRLLNDFVF